MNKKGRVLIIYTGGTFGMDLSLGASKRKILSPLELSPLELSANLRTRVPELERLADCDVVIAMNRDSAHVGPDEWRELALLIQRKCSKYEGVVVLHGTDTMAYTSTALSFLLRPCLKPVILTGAQRPLSAIRTDARSNLISAVEIAASGSKSGIKQVCIFFDHKLYQGNRVRKRSASDYGAFDSPLCAPLAVVGTEIRYSKVKRTMKSGAEKMLANFDREVALIHVTPSFPSRAIRERLLGGVSALVLVVFPSGTAPTHELEFVRLLQDAKRKGIPVVLVAEGQEEDAVDGFGADSPRFLYAAGEALLKEGGIWAGTMTPEAAFVKTAWLLKQPNAVPEFDRRFRINYAGEF